MCDSHVDDDDQGFATWALFADANSSAVSARSRARGGGAVAAPWVTLRMGSRTGDVPGRDRNAQRD